jgi:hypothetical protein
MTPLTVPGYPSPPIPIADGPLLLCLDRLETLFPAVGFTLTLYCVWLDP